MLLIEISGVPVPHAAPRFTRAGYAYSIRDKNRDYAQWQIKAQYNQEAPISGPVSIRATFHMPIPKTTSKVRKLQMLNGKMFHIKRPDTSNLYYFIENALKGIVIDDDSQVVEFTARKVFSEKPKTVLLIESIN